MDGTGQDISCRRLCQGTWCLGEHPERLEQERQALLTGIHAGMTLLDTPEMYGDGRSEELIGRTIRNIPREQSMHQSLI